MKAITLSMQSEILPDAHDYFIVLDDNCHPESSTWNNPWYLAIIGKHGEIIEQSTKGYPAKDSALFGKNFEASKLYGVTGTLEECRWWRLNSELSKQYDENLVEELKAQEKTKPVTGPIANLSKEISAKQDNCKVVNLTQLDRVAQSQAAINSAKITQLEKELKQARELQKLLKKLR